MGKKSISGSSKSKKAKSLSSVKIQEQNGLPLINEDENEELPQISVWIESYQYIQSAFPSSEIFTTGQFSTKDLGKTDKILLTEEPISTSDHVFKFRLDTKLPTEIDKLASYPVLLTVIETPCMETGSIAPSTEESTLQLRKSVESIESVVSLYEALTGDVVEVKEPPSAKKSKSKEKQGKKDKSSDSKMSKGSSKDSKKSDKKDKKLEKESGMEQGEILIGCCVIDLLPLVLGKESYTEFVPIILAETFCDDRMTTYKFKPGLVVTITIDESIKFVCGPKILHVTFESIYNIPSLMNEEMDYRVCMLLPLVDTSRQPLVVQNGNYTTELQQIEQHKYWPFIRKNKFNRSYYMMDDDVESIKNYVDNVDLKGVLTKAKPRIEFNCIKRNPLSKEGFLAFYDHVKKYQKIVVEILAFRKDNSLLDVKDIKTNFLHLMGIVDLSPLLYPGATKIRFAVPLTTFQPEEALCGGLEKSYFFPPVPKLLDLASPSSTKPGSGKKSDKASSKGKGSSKESKKGKDKQVSKEDLDLKKDLPAEPIILPPLEPSVKVYNEKGERSFIVLEIELTEPLIKKQKIEDLHRNLQELVQEKLFVPKILIDNNIVMEYYQNLMKAVIVDINEKYAIYLKEKKQCHCENKADFLTYLRRIGAYQNFVSALIQIAALLSQNRLNMVDENRNQQLVEEIFIHLNTEINKILHKLSVRQNTVKLSQNTAETVLYYAKEAVEMGNVTLGERYYLETLYHGSNKAYFWYKYAVYKMERNEPEKAYMCIQEALKREMFHKYSLLMNGILLTQKKQIKEAEMCFLTLMVHESRWVEGWVILFFFYKYQNNVGGMDLAQEMAMKYLSNPSDQNLNEDLAWSSKICPNTLFFRAATILIKMRIYRWAENALSYELHNPGIVHYLLAVICYYKKEFSHALEHLSKAKKFHGMDFSVASLTGHCFLALGNFPEANYYYKYILESFEKSDYDHLMYVNCGKTTEDLQEARKLFLVACKNSPTPYTWMASGCIYFKLNDLITAEECFSEAVILDNTVADCWGYLALINVKLKRKSEAEICYQLALKNNLRDEFLLDEIKEKLDKLK